ncbi:MAG: HYR domain-containing protein, partial [Saprospiraceae bacterium]
SYTITGNTIKDLTSNTGLTTITSGQAAAAGINFATGTNGLVSNNTIFNIALTGIAATQSYAVGIISANATSATISRNRIYNITNAGTSVTATAPSVIGGIIIRSGTTDVTVVNNFISLGTGVTNNNAIGGIICNHGSTPDPTNKIYFNSVYITGTSASGAQPSFGFARTDFSATARTAPVDIRNNIFVNDRTGGTGPHLAIANNYGATAVATGWGANASNFNVLNATNPATVGWWTSAQTFAGWQATSAGDGNSLTAATINFTNTTTADLHIVFPPASPIEGAGTDIPSITVDFDAQTRSVLSPVDIGADAGNFINYPIISITPIANQCFGSPAVTLTATITDVDGVPTSGLGLPVLYWRINAGAYTPVTATFGGGSTYTFTFGAAAPNLSTISYYIVAQDNLGNVGSSPSGGAAGFTINPPAAGTPPSSPFSYSVGSLSGTYTVGVGGNFTTLTAAANAYNISCLSGPVVFSLTDATYTGETFPITFASNPDASAVNTLTIKPTGTTTISGSITTSLIQINGGDYITINGSNSSTINSICPPVSATRNLTLQNTNTAGFSAIVWFNTLTSPPANGVTNCTIKNCIILGGSNVNTAAGIGMGALPLVSAGIDNDNNRIENNDIRLCRFGIYSAGQNALNKNEGNVITQNIMTAAVPNNIGEGGIFTAFENNLTVSGNEIDNIIRTGSPDSYGINLGFGVTGGLGATTLGIADAIGNATITLNKIGVVTNSGTFSAMGLVMSNSISGTQLIANNTISGVATNGTSGDIAAGLWLNGGTGTVNVFHNTVVMQGVQPGTSLGSQTSTAFGVIASSSALNLRNNIFVNIQGGGIAGTTTRYAAIALGYASPYTGLSSNKNVLFSAGAGPGTYTTGITGGVVAGISRVTLADWQTETGQDLMSQNFAPVFTSPTNLHLVSADPINAPLLCGGTPTTVTTDIDCQTRSTTTPTIGADEVPNGINASIAISENSGTPNDGNICAGASVTLTASGGGTYLWSTGATTAAITVSPAVTTPYSVTVTVGTCSNGASTTINVSPAPTAGITVAETSGTANNDGIICAGETATLTGTGGGTYSWSTGATTTSISVTPSMTTTYTVTVTNASGCTSTATTTITVNPLPTAGISIIETSGTTPNDGIICAGAAAQLTATGGGTYLWSVGGFTTASIVVVPPITTTFTVTVTNANACSSTASVTITVNPLPTASITITENSGTPNDGTICSGSSATLTGTGGGTYLWSTGANTAVINVTPASTTPYTVTVTSAQGCSSTASATITVVTAPTYTFTVTNTVSCNSATGAISLNPSGGAPFSYNWSTTNGCGLINGQQNQSGLCAGNYFVTITNTNGCTVTGSFVVDGPSPGCFSCPTVTALNASPSPVCAGQSVTLNATGLSGMGVTYGIEFKYFAAPTATPYTGGTTIATVPNGSLGGGGTTATTSTSFPTGSTYFIYAILSPVPSDPQCRPSATTSLVVNAQPTIITSITENSGTTPNDGTICVGASATITASGGGTYLWSTGATTPAISVTPASTMTYTVTVTNASSCSATASVTINVNPLPTAGTIVTETSGTTANDGIICAGASATITGTGGTSYIWSTGANTNSITVSPAGTTTYTVTVTNANGCSSTASQVITVNPLPGAGITVAETSGTTNNDGIICAGASATLTGTGGTSYVWSTGATTTSITVTPAGTTTYTVTVSNANGCSSVASQTITVNPLPTAGTTVTETSGLANNDGITCAGASVTITGTGGTSYAWSTGASSTSITVTPAITTTYTVTVTNANGCTAVATQTITVNTLPSAFTVTGGGSYCTGGPGVQIGLGGSAVGVNYQLQLNNVNTGAPMAGTGNALNFGTVTAVGTYTIIGTSTATGCSATMTGSAIVSTFNCTNQIFDPCTCLNNATNLTNGQFAETIKVNAPSIQNWIVTAVSGLYQITSPAPPAAPIPIAVGTVLTNLGAGMNMFIISGIHVDAIGYTLSVSNGAGTTLTIGNSCQYPNPAITSDLNGTYCLYSDPITLTGTPGDANIISQGFTVNGVPSTQFNPGAGVGQYQIVYTVDGGVPKAFGPNDPGCVQTVSQFVNVVSTPSTVACNDHVQISLGPDCEAEIVPSMILEGAVGCYDDYIVEMDVTLPFGNGPWIPAFLTSADIGKTYAVRVTHLGNGNSCWGTINVEDKIPPTIECRPVTILCGEALPSEPAPSVTGYQNILLTGLNDLLEVNSFTYNFDFSYLPTATPVLDVDVRIKIDDHTFLPDLNVELIAPSGYTKSIFTIGGCTGQDWPINCILDDDGATITLCVDLNAGDNVRLKPLQGGVSQPILFNFNGLDASGIWKVKISDIAAGDDGHVRAVGVFINVNLPPVAPTDNCGDVDLTYTDSQTGDPCEGLLVTRHWIATDQSGNTSACDQLITVLPLVLDSVDCPAAYVGHCGESTDPSHTGWPSVNGTPITDDNNVCNIFVGFWDHELNDCGNGIKIVRTWTILDWCTQTTKECVQVIKLADDQAPIISCPSNLTVGTDFWYCYANVSVPKPTVTDACGSAWTLSLTSTGGHIVNFGNNYVLNQLPLGTVTVTWTATDECGNHSSCSFTITVVDDVVPVANCDAHTVVALTNDGPFGITLVPAHVF